MTKIAAVAKSANELAEERTHLARMRTLAAADRSLMAWVRTALSLISFGFTIYKVLQSFQEGGNVLRDDESPRNIGLFLIGLGTVSMLMGTAEYWQTLQELRKAQHFPMWRSSLMMAMIISVTGLVFFLSIVTRLL